MIDTMFCGPGPEFYIDCLDEYARAIGCFVIRYHEVSNAPGIFTFHETFMPVTPNSPEYAIEILRTGTLYRPVNGQPISWTFRTGPGSANHLIDREIYEADDGSRILITSLLHQTVDANGVLRVDTLEYTGWECVP